MTNFEKWAKNPDFGVLSSVFREADNMSCSRCPAKASCPMWNDDMSRGDKTLAQVCKEAFEKWANAKADGGMDYEALAKKAAERLDKMTDEELNKDFRDYCGLTDEDFLEDAGSEEENEE